MWSEGVIGVPATIAGAPTCVHCWVKHYKNPSKYGINRGRISKLMLKIDGQIVCRYDRGWDVRPTCKAAAAALEILLYEYDRRDV